MQAEIERRLQERLKGADGAAAAEAERIRAEVEEEEARKRRELEDRAADLEAQLEAQLLAAQRANEEREEERRRREAEAGSSKGALESLQQEARAAIELQQRQEAELEVTRSNLEAELEKMRAQLATMAMESDARAAAEMPTVRLRERLKGEAGGGMPYETAEVGVTRLEIGTEPTALVGRSPGTQVLRKRTREIEKLRQQSLSLRRNRTQRPGGVEEQKRVIVGVNPNAAGVGLEGFGISEPGAHHRQDLGQGHGPKGFSQARLVQTPL